MKLSPTRWITVSICFSFAATHTRVETPARPTSASSPRRIAKLASEGIPVFLLVGNHDTPHVFGRATALEIFQTLEVPQVTIGGSPGTYRIQTANGPVQVVAVPWIRRSAFLARDETPAALRRTR